MRRYTNSCAGNVQNIENEAIDVKIILHDMRAFQFRYVWREKVNRIFAIQYALRYRLLRIVFEYEYLGLPLQLKLFQLKIPVFNPLLLGKFYANYWRPLHSPKAGNSR